MRRGLAAILIVISLSGTASARQLEPEERARRIIAHLGEVTTLSGSSPAQIRVRVERASTIGNPLVDHSAMRIVGGGRFVGFVLAQRTTEGPGVVLVGGRLPASAGRQLFIFEAGFVADTTVPDYKIPKGIYDLYLLPGGGQAEVSLRFRGPEDEIRLRPTNPISFRATALDSLQGNPGDNVYSAGGTGQIHEDGFLFQATWFTNSGHAATNYDACLWKGPPRQPWASLPRCGDSAIYEPEGGRAVQATIDYGNGVGDDLRLYYGSWIASEVAARGGTFGQSFALHTASAIESVDSLALWLNF